MKKTVLAIAAIIFMFSFSFAQTIIPAGNVSGTWTFAGAPYLIQGAIMIPDDSTLNIEPGVTVNFQGAYKLHVQGRLLAIGAATDTITFTASDTTIGWLGIRYDNTPITNDTSMITYCKIQYGKATGASPYNNGGAFYFNNSSKVIISKSNISNCKANTSGGGIYCTGSNPKIINNTFCHNTASNGGGIDCEYNSNPTISNNWISANSATGLGYSGGGIDCFQSRPTISNNIISYNSASYSGGGINCWSTNSAITNNTISNNFASYSGGGIECGTASSPNISNNIISNNTTNNYGGGIDCGGNSSNPSISNNTISNNNADKGGALSFYATCSPTIHNTILWGNTAITSGRQVYLDDEGCDPNFYYCDVQYGKDSIGLNGSIFYTGLYQNNIDTVPLFVSPLAGSGSGYNGATADWSLQIISPCINAGTTDTTSLGLPANDIAGNPRLSGGRIDIGAFEYLFPNSITEGLITFPVSIYPNPSTNNLTIEIPLKSEIEISTISGKIIKKINLNATKTTIDLGNLSNGVYILKAKNDKGIAIKKFIKE